MKHAIILTDDITQIVLTAESESEKQVLDILAKATDKKLNVEVSSHEGTIYDDHSKPPSAWRYTIQECQGGYLRAFSDKNSLMIVIRKAEEKGAYRQQLGSILSEKKAEES